MSPEQTIQETQSWLEDFRTSKRADQHRLRSELDRLQSRRSELTERIHRDNGDKASREEFDRIDREIEEIKDQITSLRKDVRATVHAKRREISEFLNESIAGLEEKVAEKRVEKECIRTDLLPEIERRREELVERSQQLDAEIRRLVEEITQLGRITVETENLEVD